MAQRLGLDPMPHQRHVWDVALEHDDDFRLCYDEADLSTMRQTSKTTTMFLVKLWRMTTAAAMWGPQRATYTAQARNMARRKMERDFADLLRSPKARKSFREIVNPKARPQRASEWKLSLNNGAEHMLFGRANYLQIDAPTATAGHGDTLDHASIDEAFAHQDDDVEQAAQPTMATRWSPQLWVGSTAGDEKSAYWYAKVLSGRKLVESGLPSRTAYFEWSVPDDADINDEDVWWQYMPALGHTIPVDFIRTQLEKARLNVDDGGEDLFRRAYCNQWVRVPILGQQRPPKIPGEAWALSAVSEVVPVEPGEVTIGFDVDESGWASIAIAAGSLEEPYIELVAHEQGTGWLADRIVELVQAWKPTAIGCFNGGSSGAEISRVQSALWRAGVDAHCFRDLSGVEYRQACGGLFADIIERRLRRPAGHGVALDAAVADAVEKRNGGAWVWLARVAPISPLVAATVARALLPVAAPREERKARVHSF